MKDESFRIILSGGKRFDLTLEQLGKLRGHLGVACKILEQSVTSLKPVPFEIQREYVKNRIPGIVRRLDSKDLTLRLNALDELSEVAPFAEEAIPSMITILEKERNGKRPFAVALEIVAKMGPIAKAAVPILKEIVNDEKAHWAHRADAARALGNIGADSKSVLGDLLKISNDPKEGVILRRTAKEALRKIETAAAGLEERDALLSAAREADKGMVWVSRLFHSDWQRGIDGVQTQP